MFLSCRPEQTWCPAAFTRLPDRTPEGGALAAFVEALAASDAEVVLVLAIDLPLVEAAWLKKMAGRACVAGVSVVPYCENRFEPFAAAWHSSALPVLRETLTRHESLQSACATLRERALLEALPVSAEEAAPLANLNTPAEAARLGCAP